MVYKIQTVLLAIVILIAISCSSIETPTLITEFVSEITPDSALSGGLIIDDGGADVALRGVCWSTNPNPTTADFNTKDGQGIGFYESQISELERVTTYYVRAYAINSEGISYGQEITFSTELELPILNTNEISEITLDSALSGGLITDDGGAEITVRGVCWSTSPLPTIADNRTDDGTGIGSYGSQMSELERATEYYVRAYATNDEGTSYGQEITFTTTTELPILSTNEISEITIDSALSGGLISDDGGVEITLRGICWSTNPNPTTADSITKDGEGIGLYESQLNQLERATEYYVRAYASNNKGTSYGQEISFSTAAELPVLSTNIISEITLESALSGGLITDDGGADITDRGVCWSTSPSPTIADNKTDDGTGIGTYESQIIDLESSTMYYVRAYTSNSQGTSYGQEISFMTEDEVEGTFVDSRDNVTYKWVRIGEQVWMAENLAYLPQVDDNSTFSDATSARYGVFNYDGSDVDDAKANSKYSKYGVSYNWYAAMAGESNSATNPSGVQGVCPSGWHLPSDAEWTTLEETLTGSNKGSQLAGNASIWADELLSEASEFGTSGFDALPGGYRRSDIGSFVNGSRTGYWWSSTLYISKYAYSRYLTYNSCEVFRINHDNSMGLSVRCIRD